MSAHSTIRYRCCVFFFFFQAEDGIRDWSVTGVQTCALPISSGKPYSRSTAVEGEISRVLRLHQSLWIKEAPNLKNETIVFLMRSEERRVGKECRSGWSPYHEKKKRTRIKRECT